MSAAPVDKDEREELRAQHPPSNGNGAVGPAADNGIHDSDGDEEEEEEEPRLKYTKLTASLASVYRNGDDTSTFIVAGDKMVWL